MKTLNLETKKVTKGTAKLVRQFIADNYKTMTPEYFNFYDVVAGLIEIQIGKPSRYRMTMDEILNRSFNFESILVNQGCAGLQIEMI